MENNTRKERDFMFLLLLKSELSNLEVCKKEVESESFNSQATLNIKITLLRHLIKTYEESSQTQ